MFNYCFFSH